MVAPRGHDGAGTGARRPCGDDIAAGDAVADRLGDALMSHNLASVCDLCSGPPRGGGPQDQRTDRKSTRLNSSHTVISYAVFCLKKKKADHLSPKVDATGPG